MTGDARRQLDARKRLDEVVALLRTTDVPFWIAGGLAIDLFVGRWTRAHEDIDVQIIRGDDRVIATHLPGWDLQLAHDGVLSPWTPEHTRNTIWCRDSVDAPWSFELVLADVLDDRWIFRRDPRISQPLAEIGLRTESGIPFVRPEIQLLFKSKNPRPRDETDLEVALPLMDTNARRWLRDALAIVDENHLWISRL